jgi:magnesium-transporting ATPase (P-type)
MLSSDAVVIRDGKEVKIPADQLVPGDIVKMSLGDKVPADLRMCQVTNLSALEAALTGESVPIDKTVDPILVKGDPMQTPLGDRHNMCFSATLVSTGSGTGIVCLTGDFTEIGTINTLVNKVETKKTNVLKQIDMVSTVLAVAIVVATFLTWCVAFFMTGLNGVDALSTSLVCAVAMVPEGLEAIVTMTYAWAVSNMAKQNAIVRALPAVETLGSVTTICSDKTGTLTKNEMTLVAFVTTGKRYRFDVNASTRTPKNFVVDDTYMAARADHTKYILRKNISKGPVAFQKSRGKIESFPFGVSDVPWGTTIHDTSSDAESDNGVTVAMSSANVMPSGESPTAEFLRLALSGGILCSKCVLGSNGGRDGEIGNPTELSILRAAYLSDVNVSWVRDSAPVVAEVPFSSEYKFMATVHKPTPENDTADYMDSLIVHVKGAPDRMIPLCKYQAKNGLFDKSNLEPVNQDFWNEQIAVLSSHGLRVLALCRGTVAAGSVNEGQQLGAGFVDDQSDPWLTVVGLCAIMDPPRPECVQAVKEANGAGVRIAMITGDHKDTALAIGGMLGLLDSKHTDAITGPELDTMSDEELRVAAQQFNVFARASPQNKIRIVKALQAEGEICGMTGDGVNDAPALKAADMGVAMGKEGTDVAREASDMILADDNFATIVKAVAEGRAVWDNLRKVLLVNTPINNAQGLSVLFGLLFGLKQSPLSSIQVLYSNLICATTLGFVTAVEPPEDGIMEQPPRRVGKRLVGRFLLLRIVIGTIIMCCATIGSVFWTKDDYTDKETRALCLNVLDFCAISITMSARFSRKSAFHGRSFQGNPIALWSYAIMIIAQLFITYTPKVNTVIFSQSGMDARQWGIVALWMVIVLMVMETEKSIANYLRDKKYDVDDKEFDPLLETPYEPNTLPLPSEAKNFGRTELRR